MHVEAAATSIQSGRPRRNCLLGLVVKAGGSIALLLSGTIDLEIDDVTS
jgi:hypothetical protein